MVLAVKTQVGHPSLPAQDPVTFRTVQTEDSFHLPPNSPGTFVGLPRTTSPSDFGGIPGRTEPPQLGVSPHPCPWLSRNAERRPPKFTKQQLQPGRGCAKLLRNVTLSSSVPMDHSAKQSSPLLTTLQPSTTTLACWPWMLTPSAHVPFTLMLRTVMSRETRAPALVGAMKNKFCVVYGSTVMSSTVALLTPLPPLPVSPPQTRSRPAGPAGPTSLGGD